MQPKCSQNAVKMQSKYSQNAAIHISDKIQSDLRVLVDWKVFSLVNECTEKLVFDETSDILANFQWNLWKLTRPTLSTLSSWKGSLAVIKRGF